MADILIHMEMPEYCYECPCHNGESGYCQAYKSGYLDSIERPAKCPLVPLPEGHGRLIDGTDLYAVLDCGFDVDLDDLPETKDAILNMIQSAETIVPSEGGDDSE